MAPGTIYEDFLGIQKRSLIPTSITHHPFIGHNNENTSSNLENVSFKMGSTHSMSSLWLELLQWWTLWEGVRALFIWGIQIETEELPARHTVQKEEEEISLGLSLRRALLYFSFCKRGKWGTKVKCLAQGHGRTKIQIFPFLEPTFFMDSCTSSIN